MPDRANACLWDGFEILFRSLLAALLLEGSVPRGSVLDAGAQQGHEACLFSESAPGRLVHAMDPAIGNVERIRSRYGDRPNLLASHGALASETAQGFKDEGPHRQVQFVHTRLRRRHAVANVTTFDVFTIDGLFAPDGPWHNESLGLLHLECAHQESGRPRSL